jgi:cytochrome oxidase Cu insertion factor (SCO1/SenC/PrrC family)
MPGMNAPVNPASPILVSAFRSALLHQSLIIALIFLLLLVLWGATRTAVFGVPAGGSGSGAKASGTSATWHEPSARAVLRIGFGIIWLFDGLLQAQPQMAGGLADQVIKPTEVGSPGWVQSLVNYGVNLWDYHPIAAAASSVWIQVGIGLWLIFARRGWSVRLAALSSVAWGLIVWAFGEAFGTIFAPGLTVLFGAPGAALIYVTAGVLVALPERAWAGEGRRRIGRLVLGGTGVFFLGMALLQAWPGRGFWQGTLHGQSGSLASMIQSMASTPQPHFLEALVSGFGSFTVSHGFAVNLVAVIALAAIGAGLTVGAVRADTRLTMITVIGAAVFCLADWVLIEDLGFLGGLGTDPNSMIPFILLFTSGYLALAPEPAPATAVVPEQATEPAAAVEEATEPTPAPEPATTMAAAALEPPTTPTAEPEPATTTAASPEPPTAASAPRPGYKPVPLTLTGLARAFAGAPLRVIAGLGALGVILVGAAPMAFATANPNADPITAESIAGTNGELDTPAPNFTLTSQDGKTVSMASLRGKTVLLTFLDPVCTTDCPIIAQEMRSADTLLGSKAAKTEMIAVVANPTYLSVAYTKAFTDQENLQTVPNWLFLTGSLNQLVAVWNHFGVEVEDLPAGAMAAHSDVAFVISASGEVQQEISADPGPATGATISSFAGLMANSVLESMGQSQ